MEWLVILLALGVAIGPILYLMPSDRDRYLTSLRALARKLGYTVQLDKVLKLDPADDERVTAGGGMRQPALACARYQLPLGVTLNRLHPITLLRIPLTPTVPVERLDGGWGIAALADPAQLKALQVWLARPAATRELIAAMDRLPDDVLAVQLDKRFIAAFWREQNPQAQDTNNRPTAWFWPAKRPKAAQTLAGFPRLEQLDVAMRVLVNQTKKHWGTSPE